MNDTFVLDLNCNYPEWRLIEGAGIPRAWHSSCVLHGCKLIVSTGCADSGLLVGHPFHLNLSDQRLIWTEIPGVWTPPPRPDHVGISLSGGRILVFAGSDRVSLCGEHQMFPGTLQYMLGK
ncbi:hypothetical protein DCAR_0416205 [Daucus carota subsp. sativus]|uniref:Uncharacterized protein n=1 Tax=Daucus carota subsp. sativus TaxID=79200 RepID=A0A165X985_DAUCS|nr:hypothetical protein DCAR_0416205 [Daucus carota subsp. sativus]